MAAPIDARSAESAVPEWMLSARCRDRSVSEFFPSDGVGVEAARRVCDACEVQAECREYALELRIDHGVWGGTSERQRRRILRAGRREAREARIPAPRGVPRGR
ncbi:MAG: WhiB family transcriptional regulator [Acidimicrobiia bacterium]|nr:WhiB family transcriptional regulator [Acidimicrobiia bacterium]